MSEYNVPQENVLISNKVVADLKAFALIHPSVKVTNASKSPYTINLGDSQDEPQPKFISKLGTVVYSNLIFNAGKAIKNNEVVF